MAKRETLKIQKVGDEVRVALESPFREWKRLWLVNAEFLRVLYPREHLSHSQDQLVLEEETPLVKFSLKVLSLPFAVLAFPVPGALYELYGWLNEMPSLQEEMTPNLSLFARDVPRLLEKAIPLKKEFPWLPFSSVIATALGRETLLQRERIEEAIAALEKQKVLDVPCSHPSSEKLVLLERGDRRVVLVYDRPEHIHDLHGIKKGRKRFFLVPQRYGRYSTSWNWKTRDGFGQFYNEYEVGFFREETHYGWHATSPEEWDEEDDNLLSQAQRRMEEAPVVQWMQEWKEWERTVVQVDDRTWNRGKLYCKLGLPFSPEYPVLTALEELKKWRELL